MANTKDTIFIVPAGAQLDEAKNAAGRTITADEITALGMTLAATDNTTGFVTGNVADSAGAISTQDDVYTLDAYAGATAGVYTVTTTAVAAAEELFITLIDVTNGRQQFPRRTFRAATAAALATLINGAELEAGDGKSYTAANATGVITITFPAGVIAKIATNEDSVVAETTAPVLNTGLTAAQAVEFVGNKVTKAGRTNRVGFPIVEPSVYADLGIAVGINYDVLTKQVISAVKFDKNVGASYQDVEHVTILIADGATVTNS